MRGVQPQAFLDHPERVQQSRHNLRGDSLDGAYDSRTDGSEGRPPPPYADTPMYEGNYCEEWNENQEWAYWRNTVENRFEYTYAQMERYEAALFGAAGVEPVIISSVNHRIENALEQYNENMHIEFEKLQGHFTSIKSHSDLEIRACFKPKKKVGHDMSENVRKTVADCHGVVNNWMIML